MKIKLQLLKKLNIVILPYIVVLTFALLLLESFTYRGFVRKYILLDTDILLFFSLVGAAFLVFLREKYEEFNNSLINLVFKGNLLLAPVLLIFYWIMTIVEPNNYPNYVFSNMHIIPENFMMLTFF